MDLWTEMNKNTNVLMDDLSFQLTNASKKRSLYITSQSEMFT